MALRARAAMNPASGPDYLRMEKYNPHPPPSARAEQDRAAHEAWPSHFPSREVIAPKVLAKMDAQVEAAKEMQKLHPNYNVGKMRMKTEKAILKSYKRARRTPPDPKQLERAVSVALRLPLPSQMPPAPPRPPIEPAAPPVPREKHCAVCGDKGKVGPNGHGQHHVVPRSEHCRLKMAYVPDSVLHEKVWLCRPCHNSVHTRWTNAELAACPWEETRFLMRNVCA